MARDPQIRLNPERLNSYAARLNKPSSDIVDAIAAAIHRGTNRADIQALVADAYDDAMIVNVKNVSGALDIVLTGDPHRAGQLHEIEYILESAEIVTSPELIRHLTGIRYGRLFLCVDSEYMDPGKIARVVAMQHLNIISCNHERNNDMPRVTAARIWWDEATGTYAVATPWNDDFVQWFKLLSRQDKSWNPEEKLWYISPQVMDEVKAKVEHIFGSCHFTGRSNGVRASASLPTDTFSKFAKLVGVEAMTKAYRAAAVQFHSDLGGDDKKMAELNQLWADIKESLK